MHPENSTDDAARFHEVLDAALDRIGLLLEAGRADAPVISQLQQREHTLRYQVRQLRGASSAAHPDLLSGLEISWGEFERFLRKLEQQEFHERQQPTPKE